MFARTMRRPAIRVYLPGPVMVFRTRLCNPTRDAPTPRTREAVNSIDFNGRRVADAMVG